jgi:hypothetical protein
MKTFKKKARYAMFKFLTRIATAKYTPKLLVKAVDWLRIKFVRPELKMVQASPVMGATAKNIFLTR